MLVMLDEPKNEKWGSEAAAPIFASIGREVLRYLEVPARDAQPVQFVAAETAAPAIVPALATTPADTPALMPDLRGKPLRQALATLAALRADVALEGSGVVVQQIPPAGAPVATDAAIRLTLARPGDGGAGTGAGVTGAGGRSPGARDFNNGRSPGARDFNDPRDFK
jgi:hypothetical protein